ncbi:hypothetical protein N5853_07450 [Bartonella sp. HY329]|uniref:hypothetical protein n=1 Tax=unclassified Bartonella TaxID=2645622 RepID=UPI0021C802B6|nr:MULTISPECIES: hypothetical protein [unclassified Bartonella]UXM93964.1 hypothetical protein N5853_07450 [Bartonella sp. HY329]UXN08285.1 hypothetical protein N5852_07460 [Bartonella sp. HY328]
MKFAFILLSTAIIFPSDSLSLKNNVLDDNVQPYSQPLPAKTNYIADQESSSSQDKYIVGIDPIITGNHILSH